MTDSTRAGGMLAVVLTGWTFLAVPLYAEETAPRSQENKPQQAKGQDSKSHELKNPDAPPPELKQEPKPPELKQEPKTKEPTNEGVTNKPVRSLILTVKLALLGDPRTAACTIEVDIKGQEIVLSGKVSNETEKLASTEIARQIEGVASVVNKLEVVTELHQVMLQKRDQVITELVRERFKKSATLEAAKFDVKTEHGVVELSGKTRFQVIVLEAAEAARQVPGVKAVKTQAVRLESGE